LNKPNPVKEYQYDMVGHTTDKAKWTNINNTTFINTDEWYRMYQETYFMAFDTLPLQTDEAIFEAMAHVGSNEVPIGIRDIDYYFFKSNALTSNLYFNFDTINNTISDIPGAASPFLTNNVFIAAPLYGSTNDGSNTKFLISPSWIFKDLANANFYSAAYVLKIDFGDGTGPHFYNPSLTNTYTANYAALGEKDIDVQLLQDGMLVKQSKSKFMVLGKKALGKTFIEDTHDGLTAFITNPCISRDNNKRKIIIYVPGFDPLFRMPKLARSASDVYNGMIKQPDIANLLNFGYEFHVIMFNDPTRNIISNAQDLISYINFLKSSMADNKNQFVVIGESMGGLVARYALSFMETTIYTTDLSNPQPERMHNTRLYISIDVPNQGANVPLAFQHLYDKYKIFGIMFSAQFNVFSRENKLFLDADAAKQMLIYHVDTKTGGGNYTQHPMRTTFLNQLAAVGNYPIHLKKVALTNGLMSGAGQTHFYDANRRTPNDKLLNTDLNVYVDFLWFIKIPIFDLTFDLKTNPNGSGPVYFTNYNTWDIKINFFWFGVSIQTGYFPHPTAETVINVLPYCTSPGGYFITGTNGVDVLANVITNSPINPYKWPEGDYWYSGLVNVTSGSNGAGCWIGGANAGFGGFFRVNADVSFCSDGGNFCFIPTISALDYTDNTLPQPLDPYYNIETNSINHMLNHTPFDVIVGIPNLNGNADLNEDHLNVRNAWHNYDCTASLPTPHTLRGNFLNREIGDDYFYLDNVDLSYDADYEAQNYIYVNGFNNPGFLNPNDPNPLGSTINAYYNFDGFVFVGQPTMYSKSNIFKRSTIGSYTATFYDNNSTFMYPKDGYYLNYPSLPIIHPLNSPVNNLHNPNTMVTCCVDYSLSKMAKPSKTINKAIKQSMMIFPNPAKPSDEIILNYTFLNTGKGELKIIDINGKTIYTQTLNVVANASSQTGINTAKLNLASGIYVVLLSTGTESNFVKLLIN
jgi:hypothetical protein